MKMAVFGTCRVNDPLESMEADDRVSRLSDPVFGFVHTPQEIMQAIEILRGVKKLPAELSSLVSVDNAAPLDEDSDLFEVYYGHADVVGIEISSLRYIRYDGWVLQRDRIRERLDGLDLDLTIGFRAIAAGEKFPAVADAAIHERDPFLAEVIRSCDFVTLTPETLKKATIELLDVFRKPVVLIGHFVDTGPFKGVNPSRKIIRDVLVEIADNRPDTVFLDPTTHISEFGFARALADDSHYAKEYRPRAGDKLIRAARQVLKAAQEAPTMDEPA